MPLTLILPLLFSAFFFAVLVWAAFHRPRYRCIEDTILFARRLEVSDLELLLDPAEEWGLRNSLPGKKYRAIQYERIRLAEEYLRRIAHNAEVVQGWMLQEFEPIRCKERDAYSEKDLLIEELLQTATDLRVYALGASVKLGYWKMLRYWPANGTPCLSELRVICGINVAKKYRALTESVESLSLSYGQMYQERMTAAL